MSTQAAGTRWDIVAVAVGAGVIAALQIGKVPPSIPALRDGLGLSFVDAGWMASILHLCAALFAILISVGADRIGPGRMASLSIFAIAIGSGLGALADRPDLLLAARVLEGFGFVGAVIAAPTLIVAATAPKHRSLALGIWSAYFPVGAAIAMVSAPWLIERAGWQAVWLANAAVCLVFAVVLVLVLSARRWPGSPAPTNGRSIADVVHTLRLPAPYLFAAAFFIYACQMYALMTWMPTFLIEHMGYGLEAAATIGAVVVISNAGGNLSSAALLHRGVPRWAVIAISFVGCSVLAWFIFAAGAPDLFRVPAAVAMSFIAGVLPAASLSGAPAHARHPGEVATCNGVVVQGSNLGNVLGAPAFALAVSQFGGWSNGHLPMIAVSLAGLALVLLVKRIDRPA